MLDCTKILMHITVLHYKNLKEKISEITKQFLNMKNAYKLLKKCTVLQ